MPVQSRPERSRVLVFDVNQTLLNVQALRPVFAKYFGADGALKEWFSSALLYSQSVTLAGRWVDFSTVARLSLEMTAQVHQITHSSEAVSEVMEAIKSIPAHPDVPGALRRLREHGFRLAALTNSAQPVVEEQLQKASLSDLFEKIFSVDSVQTFKPHPDVYRFAADQLHSQPNDLVMVASHAWDLVGAQAAGLQIAFVERTAGSWFGLADKPALSGPNLSKIADQLTAE